MTSPPEAALGLLDIALEALGELHGDAGAERARIALAYGDDPQLASIVTAQLVSRVAVRFARLEMRDPSHDQERLDNVSEAALMVGSQFDIDSTGSEAGRVWLATWDVMTALRSAAFANTIANSGAKDILQPDPGDAGTPDLLAGAVYALLTAAGRIAGLWLRETAGADVPMDSDDEALAHKSVKRALVAMSRAQNILALYAYPRTGHDDGGGDDDG